MYTMTSKPETLRLCLASSTNTAPGIMVLRGLRDKRQLQAISLRLLVRKQHICQCKEGRSRLGAEHFAQQICIWEPWGTWLSGHGGDGLTVGLDELRGPTLMIQWWLMILPPPITLRLSINYNMNSTNFKIMFSLTWKCNSETIINWRIIY